MNLLKCAADRASFCHLFHKDGEAVLMICNQRVSYICDTMTYVYVIYDIGDYIVPSTADIGRIMLEFKKLNY